MGRKLKTRRQAEYLRDLARRAGVEEPKEVLWADDARKAIRQLERHLALRDQLTLEESSR